MKPSITRFLLVVLAVFIQSCSKPEPPAGESVRPVKMVEVGSPESGQIRVFPGRVNASQRVDLAFQVSGPIVSLPVNEGDLVEAGQVVAQIRKNDYETALSNAKARLETAKSQLQAMEVGARPEDRARLEARLEAAKAQFVEAEAQFNRGRELLREEVIPESRFDEIKATFEVAKSTLASAHKELEIGLIGARAEDLAAKRAEVESFAAAVSQAELDLADTTLLAPFTGRIARKYVDNFQNVRDKDPILSLQDLSVVQIIVNLPETDVIAAKKEALGGIFARFDGLADRNFELTLKEFSPEADEKTQTYKGTLEMPAPADVNILPGMTAEVSIDFGSRVAAENTGYRIPLTAVLNEGEGSNSVWEIDPDAMTAAKIPVTIGPLTGGEVVVTEGIEQGMLIATAGVHHLREGMKVRPLAPTQNGEQAAP